MLLRTTSDPEDYWEEYDGYDASLITTNSTVKNNGELVMGRGIARQARDKFPGIAKALGAEVVKEGGGDLSRYGLLIPSYFDDESIEYNRICGFQVKVNYKDRARLDLIQESAEMLAYWAKRHPLWVFQLNFPGIGNGGLDRSEVEPIISSILPDNVHVWLLEQKPRVALFQQPRKMTGLESLFQGGV